MASPKYLRLTRARWMAALTTRPRSTRSNITPTRIWTSCDKWGRLLGIDGATIVMQRKSNSGQLTGRTWPSELGVLTVTVYDTAFRSRLQAWIDHVTEGDWRLHSS